jgi:hypothetical protein
MGEENRGKPLIESPVRIEADGTKALEALTESAATFFNVVVLPPATALSELVADAFDFLRGPFRALRVRNLRKLAESVQRLRELQGIVEPKALPPKASHVLMEQASFEERDDLRALWAQLVVNAQAGMEIDAYLFEVLSRLSSDDARLLQRATRRKPMGLESGAMGTERLESLGLLRSNLVVYVHVDADEAEADVDTDGYLLTPLGKLLIDASTKPLAQILRDREEERREAERRETARDQKREKEEAERERNERMAEMREHERMRKLMDK